MSRLSIQKTYKLFIGGKFPRTESGRSYSIEHKEGNHVANMCLASRKDFRNAVVAARKAQPGWASMTAYNRSQILYRLAEMMESRRAGLIDECIELGLSKAASVKEVDRSIDCLVYYAGWCDKYTAVFSSVNPVASHHFNFSVHEPTGVVAAIAPEDHPLLGVVSLIAPVIAGSNTIVLLASYKMPTLAISLGEVIQNSDVPGGVINILTGEVSELVGHFANHMDVNALVDARAISFDSKLEEVVTNVKRLVDWTKSWKEQSPYQILDLQEVKTTWHPVQVSATAGGGY